MKRHRVCHTRSQQSEPEPDQESSEEDVDTMAVDTMGTDSEGDDEDDEDATNFAVMHFEKEAREAKMPVYDNIFYLLKGPFIDDV